MKTPVLVSVVLAAACMLSIIITLALLLRREKARQRACMDKLCELWGAAPSGGGEPLDRIFRVSAEANAEFDRQSRLLRDFDPILREYALLSVMRAEPFAKIPDEPVREILAQMHISDVEDLRFAVLAVRIEAISTLKLNLHQNIYEQFRRGLQLVCQEHVTAPYEAHFVWSDHSELSAVMCIPNDKTPLELRDDMAALGLKLQEKMTLISEAPVVIAFSDAVCSTDGVPACYQHAKSLLLHKVFYHKDTPYTYEQFMDESIQLSYEQQKHLIEQIKAGKFKEPSELLESYFTALHNNPETRIENVRAVAVKLAESILTSLRDADNFTQGQLPRGDGICRDIAAGETVHDVADKVISLAKTAAEFMQGQLQSRKLGRIRETVEWIENNYNRDISLDDIAGQMGLSTTYASKQLCAYTGVSISSYINNVRLNHAKLLLANTKMSCAEVGEKVGFHHPQSFIRAFNKYVGMTPGMYRAANSGAGAGE